MPDELTLETERLRTTYAAFNARDIDAALVHMAPDVEWPRAFKGGFVQGHEAVRAYWTEQWGEISPHVEPLAFQEQGADQIVVDVHQVVHDLAGAVLSDGQVGQVFTFEDGLIRRMEVASPASSAQDA